MQALRWHAAGDVHLDEVQEPGAPDEGFAVVEVSYCGICGSDLAEYRAGPVLIRPGTHPLTGQAPPVTLGHEFSGRVAAVGPGSRLAPGARVTADACWRCGRCDACVRGDYHLCRYGASIGLHSDGAFAPLVRVPEYTLVELPDGVPDDAAALTEPLAVGLHALERAGAGAGEDVLVLGFGPIGAAGALCARAIGARATVVEVHEGRRAKAAEMGFATLDPGPELARRTRRALGTGGADVVLESTGVAALAAEAVECARRGGRIVLVGLGGAASIDLKRVVLFERSLLGSLGYRHDLPKVVRLLADGRLDPAPLVGDVVPLDVAADAFAQLASAPSDAIKLLVSPRG